MKILSEKSYFKKTIIEKFTTAILMIIFILISFLSVNNTAVAEVMVTPTRLVLENNQRSAVVRLINTDDIEATYRVAFTQKIMTEDGDIENIEVPEQKEDRLNNFFAQDLIRYSPRQVVLPPGQTQLVRLQIIKPADLKEGEYRVRLLFQEIPTALESDSKNEETEDSEPTIMLRPIYGVSIPVIVRHGQTRAEVELADLDLTTKDETTELNFKFIRSGNRSVYGDISVVYSFVNDKGEMIEKTLAEVKGVAVYTDIEQRNYKIILRDTEDIDFEKGKIEVIYRRPISEGGAILARKQLDL